MSTGTHAETITLDGRSLTIEQLVAIARHGARVTRDPASDERVAKSAALIERVVDAYRRAWEAGEAPATEYGVTTGFGEFKDKPIAPGDLERLQQNLLLSHSVGIGDNTDPDDLANYYPPEVVRGALATRLNAFLQGHSGVRTKLADIVETMLNRDVIPLVPLRGSVGASGDLCPLSHLFAVLLGVGRFYVSTDDRRTLRDAADLPAVLGFTAEELRPTFKEGLGLVNGANVSASMLALAVHDAEVLADAADANAAMTLEALCGCTRALDAKVHEARGQRGQIESARRMRELVEGSTLVERAGAVQDAYSLRCAPQVHGASRDAIRYVREIAERELNAATDNPLFFPGEPESFDLRFSDNWPEWYHGERRFAYSAGNFHGQPLALAADFLTIAVSELANISERRCQLMLDGNHNRGLPQNLTTRPGVNSGLMIAQYSAAAVVSENKTLAHPASVDSIPTAANSEDHVSMSTWAARKLRTVIGNAQAVLALELMIAAQALEWRVAMKLDPNARQPRMTIEEAESQARAFREAVDGRAQEIARALAPRTAEVYLSVRERVAPVLDDRPLAEDARQLRAMIAAR
jgi:histidine ammonia-lyase